MATDFKPGEVEDVISDFADGVNADPPPIKLPRTQLAFATNTTVRGQYAQNRPPYNNIQLDAGFDLARKGLFQGGLYYKPDGGTEFLLMVVSGDLYSITLDGTVMRVNDDSTRQNPATPQHWLWQSEKWVIWNDGISLPVFFNGNSCFRSTGNDRRAPVYSGYNGTVSALVTQNVLSRQGYTGFFSAWGTPKIPPPEFTITLASPYTGAVNSNVQFQLAETLYVNIGGGGTTTITDPRTNVTSVTAVGSITQIWNNTFFHTFLVTAISGNNITVKDTASKWPVSSYPGALWRYAIPANTPIYQVIVPYSGTLSDDVVLPNPFDIGDSATVKLNEPYNGIAGNYIQIGGPTGNYIFRVDTVTSPTELAVKSYNVVVPNSITSSGSLVLPSGSPVSGITPTFAPQLPAGKMGAYVMGRNIMVLPDGKRFIIGDAQGGSSGSVLEDFRDAVLHVTENGFLAGGGFFSVPGGVGEITAVLPGALLDQSLGQGPARICTAHRVFSLNIPTDRLKWQDITNPILPEHIIANGFISQNGTINCNSDIVGRAIDGLRSEVLGRRDFESAWGNVPQSQELDVVLSEDNGQLLQFCSAINFDNRILMTAGPHATDQGIAHDKLIALNFDPVSSLRGKAPSVYDGIWTGLDVLQMVVGIFSGKERAFAFARNSNGEIELHEILRGTEGIYDDGINPVEWSFETAAIFSGFAQKNHALLRLVDGEMSIDKLEGEIEVTILYRADSYPCYFLWRTFKQCAQTARAPFPIPDNADTLQLQFRPRMGLGEPSPEPCDISTNRPAREGYTFQIKVIIKGRCRFLGARFRAVTCPQPKFAPPLCCDEIVSLDVEEEEKDVIMQFTNFRTGVVAIDDGVQVGTVTGLNLPFVPLIYPTLQIPDGGLALSVSVIGTPTADGFSYIITPGMTDSADYKLIYFAFPKP